MKSRAFRPYRWRIDAGPHLRRSFAGEGVECHGEDLAGRAFISVPGLGTLYSANLTGGKGSRMKEYSDVDLERLIRHSVRPDGTSLVFMPAEEYWHFGDNELGRMLLALRAIPPVDREQPPNETSLLAKAAAVFGVFKMAPTALVDHAKAHVAPPVPGMTAESGKHLAVSCVGCHGEDFSGGRVPGTPPSMPVPSNLTPAPDGLGSMTDDAHRQAPRRQ